MNTFGLEKMEPGKAAQTPMNVLAYIGDSVFELYIRTHIVNNYKAHIKQLHKATVGFVNASTQAKIIKDLIDREALSEQEAQIVRRGRNCKVTSMPKNADPAEYRYATAFECLVGYLYLSGQDDRLRELVEFSISMEEGNQ